MDTTDNTTITIETVVNAPAEKVWEYWTAPQHITQWCHASDDWHAPLAENDVRPGGKFKTRMAAKDESVGFEFEGVYSEVEPNKALAYTISDGRKVTIRFDREGDATKVTEAFEAESAHAVELQKGGWQAILDNFKKYTEAN